MIKLTEFISRLRDILESEGDINCKIEAIDVYKRYDEPRSLTIVNEYEADN